VFLSDEDDRSYSLAILDAISDDFRPLVPLLWYYEVANNFYIQVRRKRLVFEEIAACLSTLDEMAVDIDEPGSSAILQLPAIAHRFTTQPFSNWRSVAVIRWPQPIRRSCVRPPYGRSN
jgi:hypothetical protein